MCGIISFSSKKNYSFNKIQTLALCNSYERGGDATGFYTPSTGIIKDASTAHSFINKGLSAKLKPDNVLIGHLRKSSVGANSMLNAHPFENEGVIVCHNGTLKDYIALGNKYNIGHKEYETDSQVLAKILSKQIREYESVEDITEIPQVLYDYEGAAALICYDSEKDLLFAYRDNQRPLFYGIYNGGMYISSLEHSLQIIGCKNIKQFVENTLYIIKEGKIIKTIVKRQTGYYQQGRGYNFRKWKFNKSICKENTEFTGIYPEAPLLEFIVGFKLKYTGETYCFDAAAFSDNEYVAALTRDKRYEVLEVEGSYVVIEDDNDEIKKVLCSSFDLLNVFPVIGRYCTIYKSIFKTQTGELVATEGDILKVNKYCFQDAEFDATVLKSNKSYIIPIRSFLPFDDKQHAEVVKRIEGSTEEETVEIIEEDAPWYSSDNEESDADGANWVHFDEVEKLVFYVNDYLGSILEGCETLEEYKKRVGDLFDSLCTCYTKEGFEEFLITTLIEEDNNG